MRAPPLLVGLVSAALAATVLLPGAAAGLNVAVLEDPDGWTYDALDGLPVSPPVPEPVASNSVVAGGFCFHSSDTGSFCAEPPFPPEEPVAEQAQEAPLEAAAPETVELPAEEGTMEEAVPQEPAEAIEAPSPAAPEPVPEPAAPAPVALDDEAVPVPGPGVNWAIVTAAIALPWAIGLKVLATLFGLRRAGRLAGGATERPSLREDVLQAVASEPGIRHSDLVARIGRGNGTVEHHVRNLLAEGLLWRASGLGSTLYFPAGSMGDAEARMRLALQGRTSRRMAQTVAARPGIRLVELARALGISGATAHYQAGKLVAAGVVREESGTGRRLAVVEQAIPIVASLAGAPMPAPTPRQGLAPQATLA